MTLAEFDSLPKHEQVILFQAQFAEADAFAIKETAYNDGKQEGIQEGRQEGRQEGLEEGRERGAGRSLSPRLLLEVLLVLQDVD